MTILCPPLLTCHCPVCLLTLQLVKWVATRGPAGHVTCQLEWLDYVNRQMIHVTGTIFSQSCDLPAEICDHVTRLLIGLGYKTFQLGLLDWFACNSSHCTLLCYNNRPEDHTLSSRTLKGYREFYKRTCEICKCYLSDILRRKLPFQLMKSNIN